MENLLHRRFTLDPEALIANFGLSNPATKPEALRRLKPLPRAPQGSFRKLGVPFWGVLIIRIPTV